MPAIPSIASFTGASVTEGDFKTALSNLHLFLTGLLGTDGTQAGAQAAMGAILGAGSTTKTAAYTVDFTDRGKVIACNGSFTVTLPDASAVGSGFAVAVANYGTGTVTVDPFSTQTIDGAGTKTLSANTMMVACAVAGISMAGTLTMLWLVYRYFGKEEDVKMIPSSQLSRGLGIASLAMLLWSVGIMYLSFGMVRAGSVPFGMELSSLGPFLNNQLCAGYALNVIFLAVEMYRLLMERTVLHPGCVISPAVIYLDFFYIDILGRMDTLDSVWKALDRGTVLILLEAVSGIVFLFIQFHRSRSHASDSPHQSQ